MTLQTDILLRLVRAALWQDSRQLDDFPHLSEREWTLVYRESKRQTVSGIALDGIRMLPDDLLPPHALLLRWVTCADGIERACQRMESDVASLLSAMHDAGFRPIVQKGLAAGRFYPRPRLRVCGDIDLCFDEADRAKADAFIAAQAIPMKSSADGSVVYRRGDSEVEHHSDLIELYNPRARRHLKQFTSLPPAVATVASGLDIPVPAPIAELLMVSVHILKHCFGAGIGLRHFCDYAMAREALLPRIGEEQWRTACRRLGLTRWICILDAFTDTYLGSKSEPRPSDSRLVKRIMRLVEEGGNFGLHRHAAPSRHSQRTLNRKFATMLSFVRHAGLSARLAPAEAISVFFSLAKGNLV